jgi:DNA-binding CsgD family transcriptional regulator
MPHLHQAFMRLMEADGRKKGAVSLTQREKEILRWVKEGKSTWDVSVILGISRDTVKFHMKNIFHKLNTTSRSHAIAVALGEKLIDF